MYLTTFLPKLLSMSLTASVAILFVLFLRLLLKRAPKIISYALWGIVLFRLLCPISIQSELSLFGLWNTPVAQNGVLTSQIEYVPVNIVRTEYNGTILPVSGMDDLAAGAPPQGEEQLKADSRKTPMVIASCIWMCGIMAMTFHAVISYIRLRRKLFTVSPLRDNIFLADGITSPFVMGLFRPKIYLPSFMGEQVRPYILMHEQHHIRRLDHITKVLAYLALTIHWFNPLVWVAFILAGRDMEMSCDEAVVRKMGTGILADYAASLLSLATGKQMIDGIPLAFGEGDTRGRIRNLAKWRKPAFWVILAAAVVCTVTAACLLTNPRQDRYSSEDLNSGEMPESDSEKVVDPALANDFDTRTDIRGGDVETFVAERCSETLLTEAINEAILDHNKPARPDGLYHCASFVLLGQEEFCIDSDPPTPMQVTVYGHALYQAYGYSGDTFHDVKGSHIPVAITFEYGDGGYVLAEYWEPRSGSYYMEDIREKFPDAIVEDAMDTQKYILALTQDCYAQAVKYGSVHPDSVIEQLFEVIESSPAHSSDPGNYIREHSVEYRELTWYGQYTLNYCFGQFLQGGQTGLHGHIMASVCQDIMLDWGEESNIDQHSATGQDWFDSFKGNAESLAIQCSDEDLEKYYPGVWLLLQMIDG